MGQLAQVKKYQPENKKEIFLFYNYIVMEPSLLGILRAFLIFNKQYFGFD